MDLFISVFVDVCRFYWFVAMQCCISFLLGRSKFAFNRILLLALKPPHCNEKADIDKQRRQKVKMKYIWCCLLVVSGKPQRNEIEHYY